MSALEFLLRGRRDVTVAYFNHDTPHGDDAESFIKNFCDRQKLPLVVDRYKHQSTKKDPTEASWRTSRYAFLSQFGEPVVTAHHLRDAVEWWIFSSLRGNPSLVPAVRDDIPVLRPFIKTHPDILHHLCEFSHIEDPTNEDVKHTRNFIRHEILSRALRVNPGIYTTIKNLYERTCDV
jgi:tRNA(Ile)-lysidine synthase